MKNLLIVVMLAVLTAGLTSCEKIKDIFEVEVETTLSGTLDIDVQEPVVKSTESFSFEEETIIDPLSNEDVDKYSDKIEQVRADGIIVTVESVNKTDVVFLKGTRFFLYNSSASVSWTLENEWAVEADVELLLSDGSALDLDAVTDILSTVEEFTVGCAGECNQTGVFVTLIIDIETTVIANPL